MSTSRTATARSVKCVCVCVNYIPQSAVNGTELIGLFTFFNVSDGVRGERILPREETHVRSAGKIKLDK